MIELLKLDRLDLRILRVLAQEGRISNRALAERVGLSATPCLKRVRRLEKEGVIAGYAARIDQEKLGYTFDVFVFVTLKQQVSEILEQFEAKIRDCDEVIDCYQMTGNYDYIIRVVSRDLPSYNAFLKNKLTRFPGIANVRSNIALCPVVRFRTTVF